MADGDLFPREAVNPCLLDESVSDALARSAAVACGVSGGKDSQACAVAVMRHLDVIGHAGPRVLVHSDLGMVEWAESIEVCQKLAARLGIELLVVQRPAGGLMERWEARWASSVRRYAELSTVTLVLPWSTPSMRFCTSELKTHVIVAELRRRFRGMPIVNVTGQRREESATRALLSTSSIDRGASRPGAPFINWRPILDLRLSDVLATISGAGLELHPAYTVHGSTRVSCRFCIMQSVHDQQAAANDPASFPLLRRMVDLELASTFAFQGTRWLADVRPAALTDDQSARIPDAKRRAALRVAAEARLSKDLLYVKGWPTFVPSPEQAELIAEVRRAVAAAVGLEIQCTAGLDVMRRYQELMDLKARRVA